MKATIIAAVIAVAAAANSAGYGGPARRAPAGKGYQAPAEAYHQPSYDTPPKYTYNYNIRGYGDYAPQFSAQEDRDGSNTQGSYTVALPDGRTQTVTYNTADAYSGNVAEVTYSGEAQYPAYNPAPAYKAQPSYRPAGGYKPAPAKSY